MQKMNVIGKMIRRRGLYIATITDRFKYTGLSIDGLFRGRRDTQIIIEKAGTMRHRNVSF